MFKKILLLFVLAFTTLIPAFAENFYIDNYDVQIKVNKDKSLNITENIDTYFTQSSHGIFRTIPLDGCQVTDIKASEQYAITRDENSIKIRLGDPNQYVLGRKDYKISYVFNILDNKSNELYYNIIGTSWDVPINNASFRVSMPENFDPQKVGLSIGSYGTRGFSGNAEFYIRDNNIIGKTTQKLAPREGITLRVELPNGYFADSSNPFQKYIFIGITLLITGLSYLLWLKIGKDNLTIPVVTFYPPKNINSAEAEAIYNDGIVSNKALTSLLLYLANKGYLKIIDNSSSFVLEKLKEYDGNNPIEKKFLTALFGLRDTIESTTLLYYNHFYKTCQSILSDISIYIRKKMYEAESIAPFNIFLSFACLLSVTTLFVFAVMNYDFLYLIGQKYFIAYIALSPVIAIVTLCFLINKSVFMYSLFLFMPFILVINDLIAITKMTLWELLFYMACIIICAICVKELRKKNSEGQRVLGELLGLKKFIEVTEKNRLKTLIEKNPEYFYDVLPFAYIFGISDKWIKKFETIMKISPDWYQGKHFSIHSFNNFTKMANTISTPSTANGGIRRSSSGGGGFSGGGFGGGGGGSW